MSEDKAGIVTLEVGDGRLLKLGVPSVTREVRRLLEVAGTLTKDGTHYHVECDKNEQALIMGIMQRLGSKHSARSLIKDQSAHIAKKVALKLT